jgi:hypothetical protein
MKQFMQNWMSQAPAGHLGVVGRPAAAGEREQKEKRRADAVDFFNRDSRSMMVQEGLQKNRRSGGRW